MTGFPLYLMRHGQPSRTGRLLGRTDCDVTPDGIAACVAQAADLEPMKIVTSDLLRARRCAAAIGDATIDPAWRELDFGDWDGLAPGSVDPVALARFWDDPDAAPPPAGERWGELVARVGGAIEMLAPQPTLVVTHAGAMRGALAYLCGLDHRATWAFDLPYAAVLALTVWTDRPRKGQVIGLWQ